MKIKILIPVYNDWQSVFKLLDDINNQPITRDSEISVIIVNDASTFDRAEENDNRRETRNHNYADTHSPFKRGNFSRFEQQKEQNARVT